MTSAGVVKREAIAPAQPPVRVCVCACVCVCGKRREEKKMRACSPRLFVVVDPRKAKTKKTKKLKEKNRNSPSAIISHRASSLEGVLVGLVADPSATFLRTSYAAIPAA